MRIAPLLLLLLAPLQETPKCSWTKDDLKEIALIEKKVASKDGQHTVETEHWKIVTRITPRFTAEAARFMELMQGLVSKLAGTEFTVTTKPTLVVYKGIDTYEKRFPDGSRGHFWYHYDARDIFDEFHLYTYTENETDETFENFYRPILLHEGTHAILRKVLGTKSIPAWFDEGVAMYYQYWDLHKDESDNRAKRYSRSKYKAHVAAHCLADDGKEINLTALFGVTTADWNPDHMGPISDHHYALAEVLLDHLLTEQKDHAMFNRLWTSIKAEKKIDLTPAEIRTLESKLRKYAATLVK